MMHSKDTKAVVRKGSLGKGLSSLLGEENETNTDPVKTKSTIQEPKTQQQAIVNIPVEAIEPNPHQPRKVFDEEDLRDLTASIREDGVIQPLIVTNSDSAGRYTLVAGERRLRASKLAGKVTVPAIIRENAANEMLRLALIENIQRSDLNIIEEAEAYSSLIKDYGLTQEQCADRVGKDRSTVTNLLRLLNLPREIQDDLLEERLSMGHGRALLSLPDRKTMLRARDVVLKKQLSVRQTEDLCKSLRNNSAEPTASEQPSSNPDLDYVADSLRAHLRTKVRISGSSQRGKIEISFFTAAELERIAGILGHR